jgi:hypothetical protein
MSASPNLLALPRITPANTSTMTSTHHQTLTCVRCVQFVSDSNVTAKTLICRLSISSVSRYCNKTTSSWPPLGLPRATVGTVRRHPSNGFRARSISHFLHRSTARLRHGFRPRRPVETQRVIHFCCQEAVIWHR